MVDMTDAQRNEDYHFTKLKHLISCKEAIIGVIGLGYVGLPLANILHTSGFNVIGYDIDVEKTQKLNNGQSYIHHMHPDIAKRLKESGRFVATFEMSHLKRCNVIILCLPTPVGAHKEPDMSYVFNTGRRIREYLRAGCLVVLESTTYPGATDVELANILTYDSEKKIGQELFLAYSPEREDPGNKTFRTNEIAKLIGGVEKRSGHLADMLYRTAGFSRTVVVSNARVAECAKLVENTYRAVNIALANEFKLIFNAMNVDIWEVLAAAETKPFGFQRFDPGPGIGGHCIPVDPWYLTWKAGEYGRHCNVIRAAAQVNEEMPGVIVRGVCDALNERGKCVRGSGILLMGVAYKANVDDIREAPSLEIWSELADLGGLVHFHDPFVRVICETRRHAKLKGRRSVDLNEGFERFDGIVIVTMHDCFEDFAFLKGFKGVIMDTRNAIPKHLELDVVQL